MLSFVGLRASFLAFFTWTLLDVALFSGTEFLSAWVVTRVTAKFRLPVNLGMAHVLNKLCPQLPLLKFSNMFLVNVDQRIDQIYAAKIDETAKFGSKIHKIRRSRRPRVEDCEKRNELRKKQADENKI